MTRLLDILFSFLGLIVLSPIFIIIYFFGCFDSGAPIFCQERVGRYNKPFKLLKFRTMRVNSPSVSTHLVDPTLITTFGGILRKSKLDELPQLWNVFVGDMSIVGPRPNLFNQTELVMERKSRGVYRIRPGITGLAQIKNIDMSNPKLLAQIDAQMINDLNTFYYLKFIFLTLSGKGFGDRNKDKYN